MKIYSTGVYRIFTAIALLMILFSLYQIFIVNNLKLGVDFRGGSLVVVDSKQDISKDVLISALEKKGLSASINKFNTPFGYRYEIEIPNPEYIFKSEQYRKNFETYLSDYSNAVLRGKDEKPINNKIKEEVIKINQLAISLNITPKEINSSNVNDLKDVFYDTYAKIHKNYEDSIKSAIEGYISAESFSLQIVSPLLSVSFTQKAMNIAIISALLVTGYVFFFFRDFIPSLAVLTGAFSDLVIALGGMTLFGIPLNLATFSALLMIVGYSLDTDTMLTIRMIKRKDSLPPEDKAEEAFKTGINMSTTALLAFSIVFSLSLIFRISIYYEIASIALIGLIGDIFATWGINAVILLKHIEKLKKKG